MFKNVGVGVEFVFLSPRSDGGMLGCGNAVAGAIERLVASEVRRIVLVEKLNGRERISAEEIEQMRGAADGGGLFGRNASKAEIMQFEGQQGRIPGAHQGLADHLLDGSREGWDS